MSDENALDRLRAWEPGKFMEVASGLMKAERSQVTRNVLNNVGEEFLAVSHERDARIRVREVAVKLAGGEGAATERAIQRMTMYGSVELGDLGLRAALAAGLATAWKQAGLHGSTQDLELAGRIREELDSALESFCMLLEPRARPQ